MRGTFACALWALLVVFLAHGSTGSSSLSLYGPAHCMLRIRGGAPRTRGMKRALEQEEGTRAAEEIMKPAKRSRLWSWSSAIGVVLYEVSSWGTSALAAPGKLARYLGGVIESPLVYLWASMQSTPPKRGRPRINVTDFLKFEGDEDKPLAIARQVKFYFSDSNLPTDNFLKAEIAKDGVGFVNIEILASFRRMKILGASIEDIAEAARDNTDLEVSEDGQKVRRLSAVPEGDVTIDRTIYVEPFEGKVFADVQRDVALTLAHLGEVRCVRMVHDFHGKGGGVFIEMASEEQALRCTQATLKQAGRGGEVLEVCMKRDWKQKQRKQRIEQRREYEARKREEPDAGGEDKEEKTMKNLPRNHSGIWVKLTELDTGVSRQAVADAFGRYGPVKYVEMHANNNSAIIRYGAQSHASAAVAEFDEERGTPVLGTCAPKVCRADKETEAVENDKLKKRTQLLNKKIPWWKNKSKPREGQF
ncbi:hypothetical protein T484DRAFT_1940886 [Baffinella frigidus]|nr:hypothetical protein T484DRAFT_1940886 [Cryptophyta sp. CCMP2293]